MTHEHSKRKLSNVKLTSRYHFRYMGLWIAVCAGQVIVIDALLYRLMMLYFGDVLMDEGYPYAFGPNMMLLLPIVMLTIISVLAITALAVLTAHRTAGPFIALKRACQMIRDGHHQHRLKFRDYDRLEDVAEDFNGMMDQLRLRLKDQPAAAPAGGSETACGRVLPSGGDDTPRG